MFAHRPAAGLAFVALLAAPPAAAQLAGRFAGVRFTPLAPPPSVVATPVTLTPTSSLSGIDLVPTSEAPILTTQIRPEVFVGIESVSPAVLIEQQEISLRAIVNNPTSRPRSGYLRAALRRDQSCGAAAECGPFVDSEPQFVFLPQGFETTLDLTLQAPAAGLGYDLVLYYVDGENVTSFEAARAVASELNEIDVAALYTLRVTSVHVDGPRSTQSDDLRAVLGTTQGWSTELPPLLARLRSGDSVTLPNTRTEAIAVYPSREQVVGFGALLWNLGGAYATNSEESIDRERFASSVDEFFGKVSELAEESPETRQTDLGQLGDSNFSFLPPQAQNTLLAIYGATLVPLFTSTTCDGVVAPLAVFADGEGLEQATRNGRRIEHTSPFIGSASPWICGQASRYTVSWEVFRGSGLMQVSAGFEDPGHGPGLGNGFGAGFVDGLGG